MGGGISKLDKTEDEIEERNDNDANEDGKVRKKSPMVFLSSSSSSSPTVVVETVRISLDEVMQHNSITDSWTIYNGHVYDITEFIQLHPGGITSIMKASGRDCTEMFHKIHPTKKFHEFFSQKCLGDYDNSTNLNTNNIPPPPSSPASPSSQLPSSVQIDNSNLKQQRCDSPATSWRKYCERTSKKTTQSLNSIY